MTWSDSVTLTVELSTDSFDTASPTWNDISAYVRELSTTRGRNNQLERIGPGTCQIVLDNRDRRFEPGFGTYSNLAPMNRIRVTATHNSTNYDVFYGFVDGWPQDYAPSNTDATCRINVTDLFGYLANVNVASPWYAAVVEADPLFWFGLGDGSSDGAAADSLGGQAGVYTGSGVSYNAPTLVPSGIDGSIGLSAPGGVILPSTVLSVLDAGVFTALIVLRHDGGAPASYAESVWGRSYGPSFAENGYELRIMPAGFAAGALQFVVLGGGGTTRTGSTDVCDNRAHVAVVTYTAGGTAALWVDGIVESSGGSSPTLTGYTSNKLKIGFSDYESTSRQFTGTVDEFIAWDSVLSDSQIEALSAAALGYDGDDAATRIQRFIDRVGYPGATSLESGEPRCGDQTSGGTALALLQTVDATEQGRFFIAADGTPTLHSRDHNITASRSTTVQCTFSDDAAARAETGATDCPIFAGAMKFTQDKTQTINTVTVSSPSLPAAVTVTDDTAAGTYGTQSRSITSIARSVDDARSVGDYLVLKYKDPALRCDAWTVKPMSKPVCIGTLLGLEIGDLVQVERTPQNVGSQKQVKMYAERIEHRFTTGDWTITFSGIPAEPEASTTYWQLGSGALGSTTRLYV